MFRAIFILERKTKQKKIAWKIRLSDRCYFKHYNLITILLFIYLWLLFLFHCHYGCYKYVAFIYVCGRFIHFLVFFLLFRIHWTWTSTKWKKRNILFLSLSFVQVATAFVNFFFSQFGCDANKIWTKLSRFFCWYAFFFAYRQQQQNINKNIKQYLNNHITCGWSFFLFI